MTDRKKTTQDERMEIVNYCLGNERNFKETATKYGCNYSQVYQWVGKFEEKGEEGLVDKRGKRKAEAGFTDLEKEKKIALLEKEKEEFRKNMYC